MQHDWCWRSLMFLMFLLCGIASAQVKQESKTLVVNGHAGNAAVVLLNGRTYVDLENLARVANGSVGFRGSQITLTLPASAASTQAAAPEREEAKAAQPALSRNFRMAGIETIAQMREWGSTLAYAIQNGYGVTDAWAAGYREHAAQSLSLATAAVSTGPDRDALQLLTNEFESVRQWSDKLVAAKESMDTGKYATSPNALRDEPLSQKIITCGRFLGSMLGSGEFKDDPACH